ncbi:MAG: hypothetical protein ACI4RI_04435, partial [Ruminococcus sp.]
DLIFTMDLNGGNLKNCVISYGNDVVKLAGYENNYISYRITHGDEYDFDDYENETPYHYETKKTP